MHDSSTNPSVPSQIFGDQPTILRELAELSDIHANFLEIGSWYGDSTLIIGDVARKKDGRLFCIDWWKGNPGTELDTAARTEDMFALFWQRIQSAGLEDVVVPIRSRSNLVCNIFAKNTFSFVFIDADHRYRAVLDDIQNYLPLVKKGGILCGHDCEGYISDFDRSFLQQGLEQDYYETVHCGVVLGVGQSFAEYSIDNSIWSVVCQEDGQCKPTCLNLRGLGRKRQEPPPPIASINEYHIFRYRQKLYAVPFHLGLTDITVSSLREHPEVFQADGLAAAQALILDRTGGMVIPPVPKAESSRIGVPHQSPSPELASSPVKGAELVQASRELIELRAALAEKESAIATLLLPPLLGFTRQFSVWRLAGSFIAVPHSAGAPEIAASEIPQIEGMIRADSLRALEAALGESISDSPLLLHSYRRFNLVAFKRKVYGLAQSLGPIDVGLLGDEDLEKIVTAGGCVIGQTAEHVMLKIDRLHLTAQQTSNSRTRREIVVLRQTTQTAQEKVSLLELSVAERDTQIDELHRNIVQGKLVLSQWQMEGARRQAQIEGLQDTILQLEAEIMSLKRALEITSITLELNRL